MRVLIVGDAILDVSRYSTRVRSSPEARHCWIIRENHREWTLGGAANVARWLATDMRLEVTLLAPHGRDWTSGVLQDQCHRWGIHLSARLFDPALSVTVKERLIVEDAEKGRCHQLLRVDADVLGEPRRTDLPAIRHDLWDRRYFDAVIAVDYDKFTFCGDTGRDLADIIAHSPAITIVNSKRPARWRQAHVCFMVCNHEEMTASLGVHDVRRARKEVHAAHLVITQGAGGVTGITPDGDPIHRLTQTGEVVDVTGAGDAFTAGLAHAALQHRSKALYNLKPVELVDLLDQGQKWAAHCCAQVSCGVPILPGGA